MTLAPKHLELMTQREHFDLQRTVTSAFRIY